MKVSVNSKMKEWVASYIRSHRKEGHISIHVVFSNFNNDFRTTFQSDPRTVVTLLIHEGFLKGAQAKGGYSIWLPEDEGKGQRRLFRKSSSADNGKPNGATTMNSSVTITKQTGEFEMKNVETEFEARYAFEKFPHPETGKVDVLELIRYLMDRLALKVTKASDRDGRYSIVDISLVDTFEEIGISSGSRPAISRIMQEMALIKCYGRSQWGVLQAEAVQFFITPKSYNVAKKAMLKRNQRNQEMKRLRVALERLEGRESSSVDKASLAPSFEDEAVGALAEAERLAEELQTALARVARLETERDQLATKLASRQGVAEATKQALHERLTALKKVGRSA